MPKINHFEVLGFIQKFNGYEFDNVLKQTFTEGFCYYFAVILRERFPDGEIVYIPAMGHFSYRIGAILYDVTGQLKTEEEVHVFDQYPDALQKQRIVRDCIIKADS